MRPSRLAALVLGLAAGFASLVGGSAAEAQYPAKLQWVLATAKATGSGGEQFVSSLRIVNPSATATATVKLTYLPQSPIDGGTLTAGGDNHGRTPIEVTVLPGRTVALEDVVQNTFSNPTPFGIGAGGIRVESEVPVSVLSRTFVANARSASGVPGIYGFSIPAQRTEDGIYPGDVAYLPYTSSSPTTSAGFRSNFIMLNARDAQDAAGGTSKVNVKLVKGDGSVVGERTYTLARLGAAQQGNVAAAFGYTADDTNLTLVVTVPEGGPVVVGTSIIDNAISSLNYAPPTKVFLPNNGAFGLIFDDKNQGFAGRLDVVDGRVEFLSATLIVTGCPSSGAAPRPFIFQAWASGAYMNSVFVRQPDGSTTFSGENDGATWTGNILNAADGSVSGRIVYTRKASADPNQCGGVVTEYFFAGRKGGTFLP